MKEFKVGDRVRVYGHKGDGDWMPLTGTVEDPSGDQADCGMNLAIKLKDGSTLYAHPKQCRRLKPKPKAEKKEARRVWFMCDAFCGDVKRATAYLEKQPHSFTREFREVLPGEVVVDRGKVAKAWDEFVEPTCRTGSFTCFCEALGLPEGKWGDSGAETANQYARQALGRETKC